MSLISILLSNNFPPSTVTNNTLLINDTNVAVTIPMLETTNSGSIPYACLINTPTAAGLRNNVSTTITTTSKYGFNFNGIFPPRANPGTTITGTFTLTTIDTPVYIYNNGQDDGNMWIITTSIPTVGPAGATGATGPVGTNETNETNGVPGVPGTTGQQGGQGAQGIQGPAGPVGPQGIQGPAGPVGGLGPQGERGLQGIIGPAGVAGPTGSTGPLGPPGPQGPAGVAGPAGPTGSTGPAGPAGSTGAQGSVGSTGSQGPAGPAGAQGPTGPIIYGAIKLIGNANTSMTVNKSTTAYNNLYTVRTNQVAFTNGSVLSSSTNNAVISGGFVIGSGQYYGAQINTAGIYSASAYIQTDATQAISTSDCVYVQITISRYRPSDGSHLRFVNVVTYIAGGNNSVLDNTYTASDIIDGLPNDVIYYEVALGVNSSFANITFFDSNISKLSVAYIGPNPTVMSLAL